jgi:hypothetical protein
MGRIAVLMCGAAIAAGSAAAIAAWLKPEMGSFSQALLTQTTRPAARNPTGPQVAHSGRAPAYVVGTDNLRHDLDELTRLGWSPITALAPISAEAVVIAPQREESTAPPATGAVE